MKVNNSIVAANSLPRSSKPRRVLGRILVYAALLITALISAYPFLWMFFTSLKTRSEVYSNKWLWPAIPRFQNYADILALTNIGHYFFNSVVVSVVSVLAMVFLGACAAYGLSRYSCRGLKTTYYYILGGQMMPVQVALIPLFVLLRTFGLLNSHIGIIVTYIAVGLPFTVFLLYGFFRTLPSDLEDSGRVDGCSEPGIFLRIMLPLARSGLLTAFIFQFMWVWNDFILPLVLLRTDSLKTLTVGVYSLMGPYGTNIPVFFAGLTIISLPIILVYLLFTRQFIAGITAGALKG